MIDMIDFDGPRDMIGKVMGKLYLKNYLEKFINKRNRLSGNMPNLKSGVLLLS